MERARFVVPLPESPQHRKFCFEAKLDTSKSEMAMQVAQARNKKRLFNGGRGESVRV